MKEIFYTSDSHDKNAQSQTQLVVIVGNHDVGFHYDMRDKKIQRFNNSFNGQQFIHLYQPKERNDLNFVIVNSMALENDGCEFCNKAQRQLSLINRTLSRERKLKDRVYSRPILFSHFPLFRQSDALCPKDIDSESNVHERDKFDIFKPKYDCLSKEATQQVRSQNESIKKYPNKSTMLAAFLTVPPSPYPHHLDLNVF